MDDWTQSIIITSKNVVVNTLINTYDYLDNILVFKEYQINPDDDLITQTKMFILRYRRIIGIILLIILLYIGFNCNFGQSRIKSTNVDRNVDKNVDRNANHIENIQKGSGGQEATNAGVANDKLANSIKAEHELEKKKAEIKAKLVKEDANKATKDKEAEDEKAKTEAKQKKDAAKEARKKMSFFEKKKLDYSGKESLKSKAVGSIKNSKLGQKYSSMREAGYSKKEILRKGIYNAGAYAGEKFKEFSGWLYEILFAIAISIAICMVVIPSLSFLIIGFICFFLLKSKISSFKSL